MPTLTLTLPDGSTRRATVSEEFRTLSTEDQQATIEEMIAAATKAAPESPQNGTDDSLGSTLKAGLSGAGKGLEATARVIGNKAFGLKDGGMVGRAIASVTPDAPQNYADPYQGTKDAWNKGDYLGVAGNIGRTAVQALPDMAATLAAAGIAGPAGAAGYTAARSLGENVETAQANNNSTGQEPTVGEMIRGGLVTGAQAALGGATVGKLAGTIAGKAGAVVPSVVAPLARGTTTAALEGASNFAQDAVGQLGNSVGTEKGGSYDPVQGAIAAAQGGLVRGVTSATSTAARGAKAGLGAVGDRIAEIGVPKVEDIDQAASVSRVARQIEEARAASARPMTNTEAANSVREKIKQDLFVAARQMRDSDLITSADFNAIMEPLIKQAGHHNQSIGDAAWDALAAAKSLNLPDEVMRPLVDTLTDLNVLSVSGRMNRGTGPFERILGPLGAAGSLIGAGTAAGPAGVLGAGAAALAGHSVGGALGRGLGRKIDGWMGMQEPDVIRQARAANAMLAKSGVDAGPLPAESAQALVRTTSRGLREQLGLTPDPEADPKGAVDPATGKPFTNIVDAIAHSQATGENVTYMNPDRELAPSVLTTDQVAQLVAAQDNPQSRSNSFHMNRLVADLKSQKAAAEKLKAEDTAASVQAMKDQETMDAAAGKRDVQKTRETDQAYAQKASQEADVAAQARAREAAFATTEREAARARSADEQAAARQMDAAARDEAAQGRQTAARTRQEIATRAADLMAQLRAKNRIDQIRRADAANVDKALTRNERAADYVSGVDFRQRRAAESPADQFARTGGLEGSPAGPSDPLMVKADGTPVEAPRKRARAADEKAGTTPAASPVEAAQALSQARAEPSGGVIPTAQWATYLRRHMEMNGYDTKGVTYHTFVQAAHELADVGKIDRSVATALESHHGPLSFDANNPADPLRMIAGRAAELTGQSGLIDPTGRTFPGPAGRAQVASQAGVGSEPILRNGDRGPIKYPAKYAAAARDYQAHAERMATTAETREKWPELADTIRRMAAVEEAPKKAQIAKEFMASLPRKSREDDARAKIAKAFLLDDLKLRKGI